MKKREAVSKRIGYLLKRAQHALRLRMDEALREIPLTTPQYAALSTLEEGTAALSGAELARRCFVTPQTMKAIIQSLETSGLVTRSQSPTHARIIHVTLTPRGRTVVSHCHRVVLRIEEQMLSHFDVAARERLAESLLQCGKALENNSKLKNPQH